MLKPCKPARKRQMLRARRLVYRKWINTPIWKLVWGKRPYITPLKAGRMNGRHDGYNVQFAMIDEVHSYGCNVKED